jgi:hypothetical protein
MVANPDEVIVLKLFLLITGQFKGLNAVLIKAMH